MKQLSLLILFALSVINVFAQDTLSLRNETKITVSVSKEEQPEINYQPVSATNDTTNRMNISSSKVILFNTRKVELSNSQNPRWIFPLGVSGGISLLGAFNGNVDYLFTPNLSAEVNIGRILSESFNGYSYSLGSKYYFVNKSGFSPFAGLLLNCIGYQFDNGIVNEIYFEVPVGISYTFKCGLQTSLQFNYYKYTNFNQNHDFKDIEFRIGWRFKTRKK